VILIAYDGSDDAKAAVAEGAKLFPGESAVVLVVWQHFVDTMARAGVVIGAPTVVDLDEVDGSTEKAAQESARAGTELATGAGLDAKGETVAVTTTVADALIHEAIRIEARAIVMGSRGLTGIKSALIGSVSTAVLHHADRPVVVIPSPTVVAERAERLAKDES
jgi:nucleotide-binding universal stress UspA family protein